MKTYNKPATSKLVASFDRELKALLMTDLKVLKIRTQFVNRFNNNLLPAA